MAGNTSARGYGNNHQKLRAKFKRLVDSGGATCSRCGEWIRPGTRWHLDHADVPLAHELGIYNGASHAHCNNSAAHTKREQHTEAKALAFFK